MHFCRKEKRKLYIFLIDFFISIVYDSIANYGTALVKKNKANPVYKVKNFYIKMKEVISYDRSEQVRHYRHY